MSQTRALNKTGKRVALRFESVDDVLRHVELIVAAHREGRLRAIGNWSAGQILAHLAAWIEYGYVGYPIAAPPWPIRIVLKCMLGRYLKKGMPAGVRIPGVPQGTVGQDEMPLEAAADRLSTALERLKGNQTCTFDSPAFGPMSHSDRIRLNLRHAELHFANLSF